MRIWKRTLSLCSSQRRFNCTAYDLNISALGRTLKQDIFITALRHVSSRNNLPFDPKVSVFALLYISHAFDYDCHLRMNQLGFPAILYLSLLYVSQNIGLYTHIYSRVRNSLRALYTHLLPFKVASEYFFELWWYERPSIFFIVSKHHITMIYSKIMNISTFICVMLSCKYIFLEIAIGALPASIWMLPIRISCYSPVYQTFSFFWVWWWDMNIQRPKRWQGRLSEFLLLYGKYWSSLVEVGIPCRWP